MNFFTKCKQPHNIAKRFLVTQRGRWWAKEMRRWRGTHTRLYKVTNKAALLDSTSTQPCMANRVGREPRTAHVHGSARTRCGTPGTEKQTLDNIASHSYTRTRHKAQKESADSVPSGLGELGCHHVPEARAAWVPWVDCRG